MWDIIPRDSSGQVANIFAAAPDWAIEIMSPNQRQTKVTKKMLRCLQFETELCWLIDPEEQTVLVYGRDRQPEIFEESATYLTVPEFASDFQLTVGELFDWLF